MRWFLPVDVDLFPYFEDPKIKVLYWPKMMLKLVDLKAAIEGRACKPDGTGELILDVVPDETSTWNAGKWRISWDAGTAAVRKLQRDTPKTPVVKLDIQTLAVIYSGRHNASALANAGLLKASPAALSVLDRAFPAGVPHMEEWF